jgi:hypothetical protein
LIYLRPLTHLFMRALGSSAKELETAADECWEISPAEKRYIRPAKFLAGQLDRIRGTEFAAKEEIVQAFKGNFDAMEGPTLGFRLKHVDLVDGALYAGNAHKRLRKSSRLLPIHKRPEEIASGAFYESWVGNRWFGNWLSDDCLTYRLAESFDDPVTTVTEPNGHVSNYEALLGIRPKRLLQAHFNELIWFQDLPNNLGKRQRARDCGERLRAGCNAEPHPGVFLLRGATGLKRVLTNEHAIAEALAAKRGFRILDPSSLSVKEIIEACGSARIVAGVEGSQLLHGLAAMPADAALFVIQPPERVVAALKIVTDRQEQTYSFIIGEGGAEEFSASIDEIERTLDLL